MKPKLCLQCLLSALVSMLCFSFRFVQGNEVSKTDPNGEYHRAVSETLTTCDQNIFYSLPHVSCSVAGGFLSDWHSPVVSHWFKTTVCKENC